MILSRAGVRTSDVTCRANVEYSVHSFRDTYSDEWERAMINHSIYIGVQSTLNPEIPSLLFH